jgi:M6 family metalloprotease-like protein
MERTIEIIMRKKVFSTFLLFLIFTFGLANNSFAVPAAPGDYILKQADGTEFIARQWGDEWSHGWETADDFSIVFNRKTSNWVYAVRDKKGSLAESLKVVGRDFPPPTILKGLRPTGESQRKIREMQSTLHPEPPQMVVPPTGTANIPVVMINFNNTSTSYTPAQFDILLFGTGNGSMKDYYEEVSYGAFSVSASPGGVAGWYTANNNHDYYGENVIILGNVFDRWTGTLVREAVADADAEGFNFAPYDQDGDCYVDVVNIIHQGSGAEAGGPTTDIWSHRWDLNSAFLLGLSDGGEYTTNDTCPAGGFIKVNDYVIQPETLFGGMQTMGVFAHEYGHALGLPDLYDTDGSSEAIGEWGIMASGSWNMVPGGTLGDTPAHLSAWSKYFLGWITPTQVSGTRTNEPVEEAASLPDVYKMLGGNPTFGEYFLIENRQLSGFDAGLPGAGLLIWHIDGGIIANKINANTVNDSECYPGGPSCAADHYGVALVQADNLWELEQNMNRGNGGDPYFFPGNTSFTGGSLPSSDLYNGNPSNVSVTNISTSGSTMTADLSALEPPSAPLLQDGGFESGTPHSYWNEASINFGTPFCTIACGTGTGTGPRSGSWWAWFGGVNIFPETSSIDQDITIPACSELSFYLEIPAYDNTGFMNAVIDGNTVFSVTDEDGPSYPSYTQVIVDIDTFADNNTHNLRFESTTDFGIGVTSFFIDDVDIVETLGVRIAGASTLSYPALQDAYDAALDGDIIQSREMVFNDDLNIDQDKIVTFEGGYDCGYALITGETTMNGDVFVTNGKLILNNGKLIIGTFP